LLLVPLAFALPSAGCGGEDEKPKIEVEDPLPKDHLFHIGADALPYAGPAPLKIEFFAKPFNATGEVKYRWNFDDGTTSTEQNPTHVFKEPSRYQVFVSARDETETAGWNLVVGAWPRKVWDRGVRGLNKGQILRIIRAQDQRTSERKKKLRQRLRKLREQKRERQTAGEPAAD
jgi:hypothetical protein